ncbi:MAG: hypothetical protein M3O62_18580 [Pseudomonadota bacterium]|nr:hypothetical protein [Pseudomonadota bacterium]
MNFAEALQSGRKLLWLDAVDYAGALLAGGSVPWLDTAAYLAWSRKAQSLLRPDVLSLRLDRVCMAWLEANPSLREAMAAKARAVYPLKILLADEALRSQLTDLVKGLRAGSSDQPLALECPSPRLWVSTAYAQAHGADAAVEVGDDEADSAALLMADFLRVFADAGVDLLLLRESAQSEPDSAAALECYQSVFNVATHYRWTVGLYAPEGRYIGGESALAFVLAPRAVPGSTSGCVIDPAYWTTGVTDGLPVQGLLYASVPSGLQPEKVLERLGALR